MAGVLEGEELEKALLSYCKSVSSVEDPAKIASEDQFAKGIGGSKADHIAEKQMGEMLRDKGEGAASSSDQTLFEQWINGTSQAAKEANKGKSVPKASDYKNGKWIRTLNNQGNCYLYIHTTTYTMQGTRPEDYVGDADVVEKVDPFASFPSTHVDNMKDDIDNLWKTGKVPLLLADGDEGYEEVKKKLVEAHGGEVLDVKPFVLGVIKTKIKFADHVETSRKLAVKAMSKGGTLVVDLSDCGTPDWKEKVFAVADYKKSFPNWMLDPGSHRAVDKHGQVFRKEDKKAVEKDDKDWDEVLETIIPNYRIVYLTTCGPGDYKRNLTLDYLPMSKWSALRVKRGQAVKEIDLKSLVTAIDECVHQQGLAPLVSDETENTDTFLAFQHTNVIEMKALIMKKASEGIEAAREEMRKKLVLSLKQGNTLLLRLTDTAPDIINTFNDENTFPATALFSCRLEELGEEETTEQQETGFGGMLGKTSGGVAGYEQNPNEAKSKTKGIFQVSDKDWLKKIYREEDMESGAYIARPGFKVVVTTNYPLEKVKDKLGEGLPLSKFQTIAVKKQ